MSAPLLALIAGCGAFPSSTGSGFGISATATTVATTGQLQFKAIMADGSPAAVQWSVAPASDGSASGSISAKGLYTPPNALGSDSASVNIVARLQSDPARTASETITVTPGFLQPLLPENAALSQGETMEVSAQIAEVGGGTVHWKLSDGDAGTLSSSGCQHESRQYTTCKAAFTAPAALAGMQAVRLIATVNDTNTQATLRLLLNNSGINSSAAANQSAQGGPISLGTSGSNDGDYDVYKEANASSYIADCCGGTLGALVEDPEHNQYILSNNHVLAESDQGRIGDSIDQPGLIDDACRPLSQPGSSVRPVGTLRYFVPLASAASNVDAALAAAAPGAVSPDGSILQLGPEGSGPGSSLGAAPPMAGTGETLNAQNLNGLRVVKSGRTTGLTCSTVESVDLAVRVDYYKDCAETQPYYTKTFTGQIGIAGDNFSDSGDSGSLVLDAANAQPVGLFYAGGTDGDGNGLSVANPIGDVLAELSNEAGTRLSIVGTSTPHSITCLNYDKNTEAQAAIPELSQAAEARAAAAQNAAVGLINREQGILGVLAGKSADNPGDPAVIVYVDKSKPGTTIPPTIAGVRTVVIPTDARSVTNGTAPKFPSAAAGIQLPQNILAAAESVASLYSPQLLTDPAVFGVGVAQSRDNPQEAALLLLVDVSRSPRAMPATLGGFRVRYMQLHRFHVTKSKYAGARPVSSCSVPSALKAKP